jgi:hypothetical protein
MVGFFGRGDRRGKGFGAEQLLGLAGSEVTERIDWVGGWSEPEHSKQQLVSTLQQ